MKLLINWRKSIYSLYIKRRVLDKIKNVDAIVFAGGGLIKYHKQEFHFIINDVTRFANIKNIPIVFNSVGVEGYDSYSDECQILKKALNRKCVLKVSTRDDINSLNINYLKKHDGVFAADPALWSSETYSIKKDKNSNTIGLGLIRTEIFKDYLYDIDENILIKLYVELIKKLRKKGYEVKLFTNGVIRDLNIINKIKEACNIKHFDELVVPRPKTTYELIKTISSFKLTLGVRLHSSIISYSLDIPTVGLVWNVKQILFGKITNNSKYFVTKENFNSDYIVNLIEDAIKNQKNNRKELKNTSVKFVDDVIDSICYR